MSLRSRAASGQGNAGVLFYTLRSRTASGQGHAGNTALCSGAASGQGYNYIVSRSGFWMRWRTMKQPDRCVCPCVPEQPLDKEMLGFILPCVPEQLLDKVMLVIPPCVLELPPDKVVLRTQISISDRLGCDSTRVPTRCLPPKGRIVTGPFHAFINSSHL